MARTKASLIPRHLEPGGEEGAGIDALLRRQVLGAVPAFALAGLAGSAAAGGDGTLARAVAGAARSPKNRARDPWRHPLATLAFWGLKPGMTVVEIEPAGGYWTEILAPYLRSTGGRYIAAVSRDPEAFMATHADRAIWGDLTVVTFDGGPLGAGHGGHGDHRPQHSRLDVGARQARARAGRLPRRPETARHPAVEEHRADPRPMVREARDGYVATAWLVAAVENAGFRLQAKSEINANPRDDKDHPFGVWTLPPTLRSHATGHPTPADYDAAKYAAIGESDCMTLRFGKA